jgi:type II secretory pathway pseudopilin PulG
LIVIGVIVVLIALLLPSVASVRARARTAACQSNLSQLGLALRAADRNRNVPVHAVDSGGNLWAVQIEPFLEGENGELFLCPADPNAVDLEGEERDPQNTDFQPSFGANSQMHRMRGSDGEKITLLHFWRW